VDPKFQIGTRDFSLIKLDAFKQFHIVRRVGPILTQILPHLSALKDVKDAAGDAEKMAQLSELATPILDGLSKLSDADADYVLHGLLAAVQVKQAHGNWATIYANGGMMINDLELPILMQCAGRAFVYNLAGFFAALPQ
jgi:hypothetical protein